MRVKNQSQYRKYQKSGAILSMHVISIKKIHIESYAINILYNYYFLV